MGNVIKAFDIGKIIMPKAQNNTKTFEDVLDAISSKGLKITSPVVGSEYILGNATFKILSPSSSNYDELNLYSIVLKLTFGNRSFLLCGDTEIPNENDMCKSGMDVKSDVIKIAHHGSDSSSSTAFIKAVNPKYAVISVGKNNHYGHPSSTTIGLLNELNITTYRTDEDGTIVAWTDGDVIKFEKLSTTIEANAPPVKSETKTITPAPVPAPKVQSNITQTENNKITVYVTNTGKKYHADGCRYLSKSRIPISLDDAKSSYSPCSVCNPPR